jgi:hypothetical protein
MNRLYKTKGPRYALLVMIFLLLIGMAVNLALTMEMSARIDADRSHAPRDSLPCAAIPTRFVMEHPECADNLLRSMNVTSVRILSTSREGRPSNVDGQGANDTI